MNNTENLVTKCYHVLHPGPLVRKGMDGAYSTVAYTDAAAGDRGYVTVENLVSLAQAGYIRLTDVDSSGVAGQYGRTLVRYVIL